MNQDGIVVFYRLGFRVASLANTLIRLGGAWLVPMSLLVALGILGLVRYRETLPGRMRIYSQRSLALALSNRYWEPLGIATLSITVMLGVALALPQWVWPRSERFDRPDWWPIHLPSPIICGAILGLILGWLLASKTKTLRDRSAAVRSGVAIICAELGAIWSVLLPVGWWPRSLILGGPTGITILAIAPAAILMAGIAITFKRSGRERIVDYPGRDGGFASRDEVANNKTAIVSIPLQVSHRGSARPWHTKLNGPLGWTSIRLSQDAIWTHILVDGQTGSGKGLALVGPIVLSLIAQDKETGIPYKLIVQDVKGVCQGKDAYEARLGRACICWGAAAVGQQPSLRWNPIREALDSDDPVGESVALAALLMPDRNGEGAWIPQTARPLLATCIRSGHYPTLKDIYDDIQARGLLAVCAANDSAPGDLIALNGKNVTEYVQGAIKNALASFADGGWAEKATSGHDFYLDGPDSFLAVGGYVLSAENLQERKPPLRLFWQYLFRRLLQRPTKRNLLLVMDEALAAGPIPGARDALNMLREYRVGIIYCVQNLEGIREVYGRDQGDSLVASFASKVWLLRGLCDEDKLYLSKVLGERTQERKIRRNGKREIVVEHGPLLGPSDMGGLARGEKMYWAVFDCVSQTTPNPSTGTCLPILGKAEATTPILQRTPSPEEIERITRTYEIRSSCTPPPLLRADVERLAKITGFKELLQLPTDDGQDEADPSQSAAGQESVKPKASTADETLVVDFLESKEEDY